MMLRTVCFGVLSIAGTLIQKAHAQEQPFGLSPWKPAEIVGTISRSQIPEASGLAASAVVEGRLYHVNDAGSEPSFVMTDKQGGSAKTVSLDVTDWTDTEEITVGSCPEKGSCIYIADIGDNKFKRSSVSIHIIPDDNTVADLVKPAQSVTLTYSDGKAHNAESFAIHPTRMAYILTKEVPAQLYRISLDQLQGKATLEKIAFLNLAPWLGDTDSPKKIVPTSMAIRPDGKQIAILTRSAGISIDIDLSELNPTALQTRKGTLSEPIDMNKWIEDNKNDVQRLPMIVLPQSEGITYINGGKSLLYSSEIAETGGEEAPLVQINNAALRSFLP